MSSVKLRGSPVVAFLLSLSVAVSLLGAAWPALAEKYESSVIYVAGGGTEPSILSTDPEDACEQAISRPGGVPENAVPKVDSYADPVAGGYTARYYKCQGEYQQNGQTVIGMVSWMYAICSPYAGVSYPYGVCDVQAEKNFGSCGIGNPIACGSGVKAQRETDLNAVGIGGLSLVRLYYADPTFGTGRFGKYWRDNFDRRVDIERITSTGYFLVHTGTGRSYRFRLNLNILTADADTVGSLTRLVDSGGQTSGWTYVNGQDELETYTANGQLLSITSRAGVTQTMSYDTSSRLASVTDSFGHVLSFSYNAQNFVSTVSQSGTPILSYLYDAIGNLTSVTYADGEGKTYVYNESSNTSGFNRVHALTGIVDENGTRFATFKYAADGRAISTEHGQGIEKYSISYVSSVKAVVTDSFGVARNYSHQPVMGMTKSTGVSQNCFGAGCGIVAKALQYDVNGNVAIKTDYANIQTRYTHDLARNLETLRTEAYGTPRARAVSTQWNSTFRLPTQIDEPGRRTTFTHDANGNVLTKTVLDTTSSESRTWTYTYNSLGQVLTADGPRTDVSDVTTYTYYTCATGYECGQVETITNALGHVTTFNTYNAHGQPLTITDPNGVVTTLTYDLRQRLTSRTVGTEQSTFEYWPTGLLKKSTLPDGSYLEYVYDAAHRLTDINDAEGNHIHYTLDAMGNRTNEEVFDSSQALARTRTQIFNTLNQLWKQIGAAGGTNVTTTFGYDNNGNQTSINAPLSRNTAQTYDELNRLKTVTDPESGLTTYGYDALDQLISVTDPKNLTTSYTYNGLGDLKQQVSPDTGTTLNTYDSGGNLKTSTDARSKTATYDYDALNRVTSVTYADQVIGYTYDTGTNQKGRLTQLTDNSGSTSWSYDAHGRVLSRQQTMGSVSKSIGYGYDAYGRLETLTLPSGNVITYGYANGKVVSLTLNGATTLLSNVLYHPFGPTTGWTWGNSTLAVRDYDQDGKITLADSAGLKTYAYDDAFRITGITDATNPNLSQTFGYDLLDRLTSATGTSLNQSWTYDDNGNRLTQGGSQASTYTVSPTSNRISSITGALTRTYGYDNVGNTTSDGSATYTYNDAGRMVSATKSGVTSTYALNGLGQRVRKTTNGVSTYFVYDEAGHLIGEYDNAGSLIAETIWFGDIPVAVLKPNGSGGVNVFYIHTDHLNTPRKITRPSDDAIVWRWNSDPFGTALADENPSGLGVFSYYFRFPGQYYDSETGLHYNYYRDYDSTVGRYIQSDPIGLRGGVNTYGYGYQNSVSFYDPNGLLSYNKPPPATVPVSPQMEGKGMCIENCLGMSLVITGGAETSGHSPGSQHYSGKAIDFGFNSNPGLQALAKKFFCCAGNCGFQYGQTERDHFHIQVVPGRLGGNGEIPNTTSCQSCP